MFILRKCFLLAFSPLRSQRGQAAIFVAMIFQVLFVLFAMAINVALVVHDKINLQNSVDLAAYYAAAKQAEMLNAIAHQNYQIRQAWKLFAWRYRVLGTLGMERNPFKHPTLTGEKSESQYEFAVKPALCVTYKPTWVEVPNNENLCHSEGLEIPPLPQVQVYAGFLGINHQVAALSARLIQQFQRSCSYHGAFNWWFAMNIAHAYRLDQRNRMQNIYGLAANLSGRSNGDFIDLNGDSVAAGALRTFQNNLTFENRTSHDEGGSFEVLNSLQGIPPETWLPRVMISPTVAYVDVKHGDGNISCAAISKNIEKEPDRPEARQFLRRPSPEGLDAQDLLPWKDAMSGFLKDDYQFTIGVEKNPWIMAYVGVKATSTPRQIFFPIGPEVQVTARAFAKPFGGRIGPWHGSAWPKGGLTSVGPQTDNNLPGRTQAGGLLDSPDDPRRLPNYSRFPGDPFGLTSKLAQNSMQAMRVAEGGVNALSIRFAFFEELKVEFASGRSNDKLAWDYKNNQPPAIRNYEISAIAPDLFDVTYYSIEPNYTANYYSKLVANSTRLGIGNLVIRPDLGHHGKDIEGFSIQDQIKQAIDSGVRRPESFYFIRNKANVLTGWVSKPTYGDYSFPEEVFGKCDVPDDGMGIKVPGSCAAMGGRTGYSVKLISREHLNSEMHPMGGPTEPLGAIENPPPFFGDGW